MMSLTEKLAYIQGLCEGMELDGTTKEGKVLLAIVDLLDDLTDTVSQLDSDVDQIFDEIDAIDEDLTDAEDAILELGEELEELEDEFDDLLDDLDYEDEDEEDDCGCGHHGCHCHDDEDEDEEWDDEDLTDLYDEENPLYEITCPKCGEVVCMDEDMLFSPDCACPNCGTSFEIEFDEECDCEECAHEEDEE